MLCKENTSHFFFKQYNKKLCYCVKWVLKFKVKCIESNECKYTTDENIDNIFKDFFDSAGVNCPKKHLETKANSGSVDNVSILKLLKK